MQRWWPQARRGANNTRTYTNTQTRHAQHMRRQPGRTQCVCMSVCVCVCVCVASIRVWYLHVCMVSQGVTRAAPQSRATPGSARPSPSSTRPPPPRAAPQVCYRIGALARGLGRLTTLQLGVHASATMVRAHVRWHRVTIYEALKLCSDQRGSQTSFSAHVCLIRDASFIRASYCQARTHKHAHTDERSIERRASSQPYE